MQIKLTKQSLYYWGLFVYVLALNIQGSYAHNMWVVSGSPFLKVVALLKDVAYLLCIAYFFNMKEITLKSVILTLSFFFISIYAVHTGPQRAPLFYFVLIITGMNVNFKKCVKIFLLIQLTTFILYVTLGTLKIYGGDVINDEGRMRCFLGYGWVNRASYSWLFITLELLYLKKARFSFKLSALLAAVNYYVFIRTNTVFSMTVTMIIILYGLISYCFEKKSQKSFIVYLKKMLKAMNNKKTGSLAVVFFVFTIIIGAVLPIKYNHGDPVMYKLNKMVTGRLFLGKIAIERYGLHLGGNKLQWAGSSTMLFGLNDSNEYFYVDNGFLQMALEFGVLYTGFIIFVYLASIKKAGRTYDKPLISVILFLAVLYVFEPYVVDFAFNPFVLYYFSSMSGVNIKDWLFERLKIDKKKQIL